MSCSFIVKRIPKISGSVGKLSNYQTAMKNSTSVCSGLNT